jgi:hypothetical protein
VPRDNHTILGGVFGLVCLPLGYAAALAAVGLGVWGGTVPPGFPKFYGETMLLLLGAGILLLVGMVGLLLARRFLLVLGQLNLAVFVAAVVGMAPITTSFLSTSGPSAGHGCSHCWPSQYCFQWRWSSAGRGGRGRTKALHLIAAAHRLLRVEDPSAAAAELVRSALEARYYR